MADGFVGGGVFAEVVADVFGGDGEGEVFFAVVDGDGHADHFGEDDHVAVVGADGGFLAAFGALVGFAEAFEELALAGWEAAAEAAALAAREELDELVHGHALEGVQVVPAVFEFPGHGVVTAPRGRLPLPCGLGFLRVFPRSGLGAGEGKNDK